jgi:hypothetical protein
MKKPKITIKPFEYGEYIKVDQKNPDYGYILLESDEIIFDKYHNRYFYPVKSLTGVNNSFPLPYSYTEYKNKLDILHKIVDENNIDFFTGRIRIVEYFENEVPTEIWKKFINEKIPYKEAVAPYLKQYRYEKKERFIMQNFYITHFFEGKRILHFCYYDELNRGNIKIDKIDNEIKNAIDKIAQQLLFQPFESFKTQEEYILAVIYGENSKKYNEELKRINKEKETITEQQEKAKKEEQEKAKKEEQEKAKKEEQEKAKKEEQEKAKKEEEKGIKKVKERIIKENITSNTSKSHEAIKKENPILIPIAILLIVTSIALMVIYPVIFTVLSIAWGLFIIIFFAGWSYNLLFTKDDKFDLLKYILTGVVVIFILSIIMLISDLTKTPHDPDMWPHP